MKTTTDKPFAGTVYYDGACSFCTGWAHRLEHPLAKRGYVFATLQSRPELATQPLTEMRLRLPDNREFGGVDAALVIARRIWWAWPLYAMAQVPGMMRLLRRVYGVIAANRYCLSGACKIKPNHHHHTIAFLELP